MQTLGAHPSDATSKVLHRQGLTLQCGMPNTPDNEIRGILDVIKGLTGEYRAQGEEMDIGGNIHSQKFYRNSGEMKPYEANLTEDEMIGIFQALKQMPHYRPIERTPDSMDFEIEVMRRYPQFFGGK